MQYFVLQALFSKVTNGLICFIYLFIYLQCWIIFHFLLLWCGLWSPKLPFGRWHLVRVLYTCCSHLRYIPVCHARHQLILYMTSVHFMHEFIPLCREDNFMHNAYKKAPQKCLL